jgi:hypothetical protein
MLEWHQLKAHWNPSPACHEGCLCFGVRQLGAISRPSFLSIPALHFPVILAKAGIRDSLIKKNPAVYILAHKRNGTLGQDMTGGLHRRADKQVKQGFAKRRSMIFRSGTKIWIPAFAGITNDGGGGRDRVSLTPQVSAIRDMLRIPDPA